MNHKPTSILFGALLAGACGIGNAAEGVTDDPGLVAWMQSANAAQQARFEELAGREDPRSKLMAMHLVHPMFPLRDDPEAEIAAEQARAWTLLEEAAAAEPGHVVAAWRMATCVPDPGPAACGSDESVQALQAAAGDRASVQLWLADAAHARGDASQAERHLAAAATADSFGALDQDEERLLWGAWAQLRIPEPTPRVATLHANAFALDPDAVVEQTVAVSVVARVAALPYLGFEFLAGACDVDAVDGHADGQRREQCVAVMTLLADEATTLVHRLVAEPILISLSEGSEATAVWRERLRTTMWVFENASLLQVDRPASELSGYFRAWREAGEWEALRWLLADEGVAEAPHAGWLPQAPRMRALIAGEQAPPPASATTGAN